MKKTLLLLVANLQQGGQERVVINTAEILKNDYNIVIAVFDDSNRAYSTDAKVIDLNMPSKEGIHNKITNESCN